MEPLLIALITGIAAIVGAVLVAVNRKQLNARYRERHADRAADRRQR